MRDNECQKQALATVRLEEKRWKYREGKEVVADGERGVSCQVEVGVFLPEVV